MDKGATVTPKEKEKEVAEKRGRGRPRKQPQVKTSDVSVPPQFIKIFFNYFSVINLTVCSGAAKCCVHPRVLLSHVHQNTGTF